MSFKRHKFASFWKINHIHCISFLPAPECQLAVSAWKTTALYSLCVVLLSNLC